MKPHDIIHVESYSDLEDHPKIRSRAADVITELFSEGIETVIYIPKWIGDDTELEPISGGDTLFVADVKDHSEKSWMVSQPGSQAEFIAKSQARVFRRATDEIESPQQGLDAFATGGSR